MCVSGYYLFTSSGKRTITAWDTRTTAKRELKGHEQTVNCLLADQGVLYSGSTDKTIHVWNVQTGKPTMILRGHQGAVLSLWISDELLFSSSADGSIRSWNRMVRVVTMATVCLYFFF